VSNVTYAWFYAYVLDVPLISKTTCSAVLSNANAKPLECLRQQGNFAAAAVRNSPLSWYHASLGVCIQR
jgi:hypothetical protein